MSQTSQIRTNLELLQKRDRSPSVFDKNSLSDLWSWLASCSFHTLILIVLALLWRPQTSGKSGEPDRPVGIAFVQETEQGGEYSQEGGASGANSSNSAGSQYVSLVVENIPGPPISIENIVAGLMGTQAGPSNDSFTSNDSLGKGLPGDGGSGSGGGKGLGSGSGAGKKSKASFFGVEGTGSSFVFVVDRSDSMNAYDSAPLRFAKRELIKSLESLNDYNQFQIVFYNDSLSPMSSKMIFAEDGNKRKATNFVNNMPGDGSTKHLPALKLALSMVPDVLFFLTDADDRLTAPELLDLQRRAELARTTIHTIQFSGGPATTDGSWIRGLAEMNRGTYTYIDVTTFRFPLSK